MNEGLKLTDRLLQHMRKAIYRSNRKNHHLSGDNFSDVLDIGGSRVGWTSPEFAQEAAKWIIDKGIPAKKTLSEEVDFLDWMCSPINFAKFINLILNHDISRTTGDEVFDIMVETNEDPEKIVEDRGLWLVDDEEILESIVDDVVEEYSEQVKEYENGNYSIINFFIAQVMEETSGSADVQEVKNLFKQKLDSGAI